MNEELLLIVDVQNGFVSELTAPVVPEISHLLDEKRFPDIAFTRFENPEDSVYERYLHWTRLRSDAERAIHPSLEVAATTLFRKTYYSAVTAEFRAFVIGKGFTTIYICGIDTDCCVLTSAVDIMGMGLRPVVLADYCASNGGPASHEAALRVLTRLIGPEQILHGKI